MYWDCNCSCGIYDHENWKEDSHLNTEARRALADVVEEYRERQSNAMLAIDQFASADLVLA
jgi:hypothetical protein